MLNITLDVNDFYFSYGLESLLRESEGLSEHEVNISYGLDDKSVGHADIIVTTFLAGEAYICHDIFKKRKPGGWLICIFSGKIPPRLTSLPSCFNDAIFISRYDDISALVNNLVKYNNKKLNREGAIDKCLNCNCRNLTGKQLKIATYIYCGLESKKIADNLSIDIKTVYAHKKQLMQKFDLSTDYELFEFLTLLKNKTSFSNTFGCLFK